MDGLFANDPVMNYECKKAILSHNKYISDPSIPAIFLYQKIELVFKQIYELLSEEAVKAVYSCAAVSSMPDIYEVYIHHAILLKENSLQRKLRNIQAKTERFYTLILPVLLKVIWVMMMV